MSKNTTKRKSQKKINPKPKGYVFGRPTLYKDKYVQMMEDYFNVSSGKVTVDSDEGAIYLPANFPTKQGFGCLIKVHRDTLYEQAHATNKDGSLKYPEFSDT